VKEIYTSHQVTKENRKNSFPVWDKLLVREPINHQFVHNILDHPSDKIPSARHRLNFKPLLLLLLLLALEDKA
jgi:hypothetical protein